MENTHEDINKVNKNTNQNINKIKIKTKVLAKGREAIAMLSTKCKSMEVNTNAMNPDRIHIT